MDEVKGAGPRIPFSCVSRISWRTVRVRPAEIGFVSQKSDVQDTVRAGQAGRQSVIAAAIVI